MRWAIQIQVLLPTLAVVVEAIALSSATTAYYGALRATRQQDESLRRTMATLMEATVPMTERVLHRMKGLSGAEFVLLDDQGRCQAATLRLSEVELPLLGRVPTDANLERLAVRARLRRESWAFTAPRAAEN